MEVGRDPPPLPPTTRSRQLRVLRLSGLQPLHHRRVAHLQQLQEPALANDPRGARDLGRRWAALQWLWHPQIGGRLSLITKISPDKPLAALDGLSIVAGLRRRWPNLLYQVDHDRRGVIVTTGLPSHERILRLVWVAFDARYQAGFGERSAQVSRWEHIEDGVAAVVQQLRERLQEVGGP